MTLLSAAASSRRARWPDLFWSSRDLFACGTWRRELPEGLCDEFLADVARASSGGAAVDFPTSPREDLDAGVGEPQVHGRHWLESEHWLHLRTFADELRRELTEGVGFVCISGLDRLGLDRASMQRCYATLGEALGKPLTNYGLLYPVTDRGLDHRKEAIPVSMTGAETCFHTDSSSRDVLPDFVGLLCETPSEQGGDSLISNALLAHERMREEAAPLLAELERPLIRDIVTPGREKTRANLLRNRFPVFAPSDQPGGLDFRYMRYWIETGHLKAGTPIDARQRRAFDLLDRLLEDERHVLRFRLQRGDALWVNNRVMAHNRTAFTDTPDNVRCLQRMWVSRRPGA